MKSARAKDHWRRITEDRGTRPLRLLSCELHNLSGSPDIAVRFHDSLTVLCGSNGVGKTTILAALQLAIDFKNADARNDSRLLSSQIDVTIAEKSSETRLSVLAGRWNQETTGKQINVCRLDSSAAWFAIKGLVNDEQHWDELLEQCPARQLTDEELTELSYLTGKEYVEGLVYEIDEYEGGSFPYFVVTNREGVYCFEAMGAGEGALFLAWWSLRRISGPGILLFDEPETHVTARSQRALMDLVAQLCDKKKVVCVVTTHSSVIVSAVPRQCIRLVMSVNGVAEVIQSPTDKQLHVTLGMEIQKRALIFVEDRCARLFASELIRRLGGELTDWVEILDAGSNSDIEAVTKNFPEKGGPKVIGLFDGDQKQRMKTEKEVEEFTVPKDFRHTVAFLPGDQSPEAFLRSVSSKAVDQVADKCGVERLEMMAIVSSLVGQDDHDWLEGIAHATGLSLDRTVAILIDIAIQDDVIKQMCQDFCDKMNRVVVQ